MGLVLTQSAGTSNIASTRSKRRILIELGICYTLILLVIWTPRPVQKLLWWVAAAAIVVVAGLSFKGFRVMGLRAAGLAASLWVVGAALLLAGGAVFAALELHTLHLPPGGAAAFIKTYWAYALWACFQQLLLQGFFLPRFLGLLPNGMKASALAAGLFALAHLPNPILTPVTLLWGFVACLLFLRYRNLFPLAIAHAIFGITIAITIPGPVIHNMRVGLGYLRYHHPSHATHSAQP